MGGSEPLTLTESGDASEVFSVGTKFYNVLETRSVPLK